MSNERVDLATKILWYGALAALACGLLWLIVSCCPKPPPIGPPTVVEQPCELPPVPVLPVAKVVGGCDVKLFCYDAEGAVAIVERDGALRQWIREVVARCSKKPTEARDAGSSDQAR